MIRHAFRTIGRMPGLAAVVILSLGVGIGVNTTVFSWIQAMLLHPIPGVADSGSFYHVDPKSDSGTYPGMSWTEYQDLKPRLQSIEELVAFRMAPLNVGEAGRTERTYAQLVSGNLFSALHLQPASGRFITPNDTARPGGEPVVVLSHVADEGVPALLALTLQHLSEPGFRFVEALSGLRPQLVESHLGPGSLLRRGVQGERRQVMLFCGALIALAHGQFGEMDLIADVDVAV